MNRAGHGEYFPSLLERRARRDQRSRRERGLDHQRAERQPADDAIPSGKILSCGGKSERKLGHEQAAPGYFSRQRRASRRIDDVDARA